MSDLSDFDRVFAEMIRLTERLFEDQTDLAPASPQPEQAERDELIERADSFEYILDAPGYEEGQLLVSVQDEEIDVKAPDLVVRRRLPAKVNPDSAVSQYRNGVLSVTVKKL